MGNALCATAFHEASHVVVAQRLGLPVHSVSVRSLSSERGRPLEGATRICWDLLLGKREDLQLCRDAMTAAYAGIAWEAFARGRTFDEVYPDCPSDSEAVGDIRRRFNERGAFPTDEDSRQTSKNARDSACVMVAEHRNDIERLAWFLCFKRELFETQISVWFGRAEIARATLAYFGRTVRQFERCLGKQDN
jgi:hypothetical protein